MPTLTDETLERLFSEYIRTEDGRDKLLRSMHQPLRFRTGSVENAITAMSEEPSERTAQIWSEGRLQTLECQLGMVDALVATFNMPVPDAMADDIYEARLMLDRGREVLHNEPHDPDMSQTFRAMRKSIAAYLQGPKAQKKAEAPSMWEVLKNES